MKSILEQIDSRHHGELLKNYVRANGINKKGGINDLAKTLGLTRQGIYVLYQQNIIKPEYRHDIIEALDLPEDFFPDTISLEQQFELLVRDYTQLRIDNLRLKDRLEKAKARTTLRNYLNDLRREAAENQEKNVRLVTKQDYHQYIDNYYDEYYLDNLPKTILEDVESAIAFEVSGNGLEEIGISRGDYLYSDTLMEYYDTIRMEKLYIVVLDDQKDKTDIYFGHIRSFRGKLSMLLADRKTLEIDLTEDNIEHIWEVNGKMPKCRF
ncbi:hypothetical protein [Aquimarina sediminis]|uniref:hypothetical protein n=1 Tax=Aquimarina sediminis TaxID=2070536 RepID=UPI000CA050F8|nr:hypothetical protein [Aquimarina sediminis]